MRSKDDFPHVGYRQLLEEVLRQSAPKAESRVLDLGIGTGNLALLFEELDCEVWGVDFSPAMIAQAERKLARARIVEANLLGPWFDQVPGPFDRIVSTYALHHFELTDKCRLIKDLSEELLSAEGRIVVGDISFETQDQLLEAKERASDAWKEEEYWVAEPSIRALSKFDLTVDYRQVSWCGGVYCIRRVNV